MTLVEDDQVHLGQFELAVLQAIDELLRRGDDDVIRIDQLVECLIVVAQSHAKIADAGDGLRLLQSDRFARNEEQREELGVRLVFLLLDEVILDQHGGDERLAGTRAKRDDRLTVADRISNDFDLVGAWMVGQAETGRVFPRPLARWVFERLQIDARAIDRRRIRRIEWLRLCLL